MSTNPEGKANLNPQETSEKKSYNSFYKIIFVLGILSLIPITDYFKNQTSKPNIQPMIELNKPVIQIPQLPKSN